MVILKAERVVVFNKGACTYDGPYSHAAIPRKGMMYCTLDRSWTRIHPINTGFLLREVKPENIPPKLKTMLLLLNI